MRTVHRTPQRRRLLAVKGSPDEVLAMCAWSMQQGRLEPLTALTRHQIAGENTCMAGASLRVLGLAYREWDGHNEPAEPLSDLVWLGFTGMADPVRHGVAEVIGDFHRAGIDTVMITGDQSPTAYAIGRELGLNRNGSLETLDSTHLSHIEPEVLTALARRVHIFARATQPANPYLTFALAGSLGLQRLQDDIRRLVIAPVFANEALQPEASTQVFINPDGAFIGGGPSAHAGLTGRKNAVDTYGEYSRQSGAALSGKDPTRIDRVGAYAARYAAKNVVAAGLAEECEVQLSYSIGQARPVSIQAQTFGTGTLSDATLTSLTAPLHNRGGMASCSVKHECNVRSPTIHDGVPSS